MIALEIPKIGDAAEKLYRQIGLWETRPNPEDTGFEMLRHVSSVMGAEFGRNLNMGSDRRCNLRSLREAVIDE